MTSDIEAWLDELGLVQYAGCFSENDIDMDILGELTENDLKELGLSLGHRKRILKAIDASANLTRESQDVKQESAERRQLTVMFCDLVDSTTLSVRVDAEDLRHIISNFQKCCEQVVSVFGGSVARYMGDGLLVYFGYPVADEHDPERAIRAGLEITRAVGELNAGTATTLQTRVGIATGEVVVGDLIGKGHSQEHAVIGETPNLAARLQSLAEPDTVVVAPTTRKLAGRLFAYHDLGAHQLKGFERSVQAWRVENEIDVESRFEATHADADLSAFVGREAQIDILLERWARARDGEGQVALVQGEAGIGKSRLSLALRKHIMGEPHTLVRYFCVPYHQKTALHPFAMQLQRAARIARSDDPDLKLRKIEMMVARFAEHAESVVPLYASLLGVPLSDRFPEIGDSPRLQKEHTLAALESQLVSLAGEQPVLVIFEDLHWIDPTSLELLERTIQRLSGLRMMFVLTGRPEFVPAWPHAQNTVGIRLEALEQQHVLGLIELVTGGKRLPDEIVEQIVAKTDGIPLFVEELTQMLLESGKLEERDGGYDLRGSLPDLAIPDTLQDSLMARLDRLGTGKKAAQIGAAIGRTFSHELIARVSDFGQTELDDALQRLLAAGLVFRKGNGPSAVYLFKHALVQDAAYSTLLKDKRRKLHRTIAGTLELYFPETTQHNPETIAHHYTLAGENAQAIPHWEAAARHSIARAAHKEAQRELALALDLLKDLPRDSNRLQLEVGLQTAMGLALESTRGYAAAEVENAYDRAKVICEQLDKTAEFVPVLLGLYVFNFVRGNFLNARSFVMRCVELAKKSRRLDYLIESFAALGFVQGHMGELAAARATLENCSTLYDSRAVGKAFPKITAQDPGVAARSLLPIILLQLGEIDQARHVMQEAFVLAEQLGQSINRAVAHTHAAEFYALQQDYENAVEHGQAGMKVSMEHGHDAWYICSMIHTGIAQNALDGSQEGVSLAQQGLAMWEGAGARVNASYFIGRTAWSLHASGCHEEGLALLRRAFEYCERSNEDMHISMLNRQYGEMLLDAAQPDQDAAEKCFLAAIELAAARNARLPQLRATICLHKQRTMNGRSDMTTAALADLVGFFPDHCDLVDLQDARALLQQG